MRFTHAESANGLASGNRFPKPKNSAACQRRPSRLPPARTSPQALLMTTPAATMPNRSKPFTTALRGLSTNVSPKSISVSPENRHCLSALPPCTSCTRRYKHFLPNRTKPKQTNTSKIGRQIARRRQIASHIIMNTDNAIQSRTGKIRRENNGNYRRHSSFGQFPHLFSIKQIRKITTGTHARKNTEKRTDPNIMEYTAPKDPG